ncbi:MAG: DUF4129 domain-containing protein [Oscillospiraceae bacterium]|nr:DUF4129 domain-containing protein [Oscillospiraceae bacterium]
MIFIHTLRMMADLSVYFFIAELLAVSMGASSQFIHFILLSLCYGVMVFMQKRSNSNLYMLLPLAVLFIPDSYLLVLAPPVAYILYLVYTQRTTLSHDRQSELFSGSIKFFPIAAMFLCFLGKSAIFIQYSLPMVFVSLSTSIFLMRMLRQPPAVYLDPLYQRRNCIVFIVLLCTAWLLSQDFMFRLVGGGLSFVYMKGIYPILNGFIWLFMGVLRLIMYLFSWFKFGEIRFEENHLAGGDFGPSFKDAVILEDNVATTQSVLTIVLVILLLACAFYFFRWLALHNGEESFISQGIDIIRGKDTTRIKKERATTTALKIRRQYRQFLKLYKEQGGKIETASTSQDVLERSATVLPDASTDLLEEMRQIYLSARYGGNATKSDLKRIRQINKELTSKNI